MRVFWYVVVVALGAIGTLSIVRFGERLVFGGAAGSSWPQLLLGLLCFLGAWQALRRARAR
jgi:hypothetical protein